MTRSTRTGISPTARAWRGITVAAAAAIASATGIATVLPAAATATPGASAAASATTPATTPAAPFLATLGTRPDTAAAESAAGVKVGMVELNWNKYEPQRGVYDTVYVGMIRQRIAAMKAAGMRVTLGVGLHFAPAWALAMTNSRLVDQHGTRSSELNLVFNVQMRYEANHYFDRIDADLGFENFWAVRITSGTMGEVLYPEGGSYWAFDPNAQNGRDMPASMRRNPVPGWKPGTPGPSTDKVDSWARWYVAALADTANWQIQKYRLRGFTGYYQVLTPGFGLTPNKLRNEVARNLPDGVAGVGAVWGELYKDLPDKRNVVAYVTSIADGSGGNDSCTPADRSVALTAPDVAWWSATRWISRVADENGLGKAGENPGYRPTTPFDARYRDVSATGLVADTMRQASTCGLSTVYWAHDDQFHGSTQVLPLSAFTRYAATGSAVPAAAPRR